ncbi:HAD-IIA family hydrolase [Halobellus ruber]|uniref:HAD-IIA family hydrolase n=1 Tax=Halobellus ruber TaxID=2761102 RepID=A0A7J9SFS1_9EURY|nr:HAD-IIA family hydrolase [Halobellus ruber]MBB6645352.1 HAD-IIA family hydrolase [Halobellus ruber]
MTLRGVIFDVDGTLVRGDEPLPGAAAGLAAVDDAGLRRLFVSNNPTKPPADYERRLGRAGFDVDSEEVITAGSVSARYLSAHHAGESVAVVGEPGFVDLLRQEGLTVRIVGSEPGAEPTPRPDVLVASIDREFHYRTLRRCLRLLDDPDVTFLGTDPDVVIPAPEGNVPGSGAVIDAIANVVGRDPAAILGKPSRTTRDMALERLGLRPEEVLVVGDRLDTDIALAEGSGMRTALVRTGVTDDAALDGSPIRPDHVLDSLAALESLLCD